MKYNRGRTLLVTGALVVALLLAACRYGSELPSGHAPPEPPLLTANSQNNPLATGPTSPATEVGECPPGEEAAAIVPDPTGAPSAAGADELDICNTQTPAGEQTDTVNTWTAPTDPVSMTPEEIDEFKQLPSVKSGELVIPPLAPADDDGQGATR